MWGLTIWCIVRYRRKKDDVGLPPQLRYNVPIEILYTIIPVMMVGVLFFFTARDEAVLLDTSAKPDYTINVVGKQWSWDFNYVDDKVWDSGIQADLKSIAANGGYGMAVLTALTAQNTRGVRGVHVPPVEFLRAQLEAVSDDIVIDAADAAFRSVHGHVEVEFA